MEDLNLKHAAAAGVIGLIISFVSGGIAGVDLGILIFRALIGGVLFFILGAVIQIIIARFLPELTSSGSVTDSGLSDLSVSDSFEESESGGHVNIVSDDEASPYSGNSEPADVEGLSENNHPAEEINDSSGRTNTSETPSVSPVNSAQDSSILNDSVSDLPDLDSFSGTFQHASDSDSEEDDTGNTGGEDKSSYGSFSSSSSADGSQIAKENDPADIAKAIRTVLNRDNG